MIRHTWLYPAACAALIAGLIAGCAAAPAAPAATPTLTPAPPTSPPPPTAAPLPTATMELAAPTLRETPLALPPGLTVEEYALRAAPALEPLTFELAQGATDAALSRRAAARDAVGQRIAAANQALAAFGYRLAPSGQPGAAYRLYRGDELILDEVSTVGPISVGTADFILPVDASPGSYLLHRAGLIPRDGVQDAQFMDYAAYLDSDLITAKESYSGSGASMTGTATVYKNGAQIFSVSTGQPSPSPDLYGLWTYAGHWAIEVKGQVVVDGQALNAAHGYQESFGFQLMGGQPFYFFKQGDKIGAAYAGEAVALDYDEVPHYNCCSDSALNPGHAADMAWLFARRGATWYYVEIGAYP